MWGCTAARACRRRLAVIRFHLRVAPMSPWPAPRALTPRAASVYRSGGVSVTKDASRNQPCTAASSGAKWPGTDVAPPYSTNCTAPAPTGPTTTAGWAVGPAPIGRAGDRARARRPRLKRRQPSPLKQKKKQRAGAPSTAALNGREQGDRRTEGRRVGEPEEGKNEDWRAGGPEERRTGRRADRRIGGPEDRRNRGVAFYVGKPLRTSRGGARSFGGDDDGD